MVHVFNMEGKRNVHKLWLEDLKKRRTLVRPRQQWKKNIKVGLE
jgi:hypothetical protein